MLATIPWQGFVNESGNSGLRVPLPPPTSVAECSACKFTVTQFQATALSTLLFQSIRNSTRPFPDSQQRRPSWILVPPPRGFWPSSRGACTRPTAGRLNGPPVQGDPPRAPGAPAQALEAVPESRADAVRLGSESPIFSACMCGVVARPKGYRSVRVPGTDPAGSVPACLMSEVLDVAAPALPLYVYTLQSVKRPYVFVSPHRAQCPYSMGKTYFVRTCKYNWKNVLR